MVLSLIVQVVGIQGAQRIWYLEARGGIDIYQNNFYQRAAYSSKEIWGLTAGLGIRKDISFSLSYTCRHDVHEKDDDRSYPDYYDGGYYHVHFTELGTLKIRELSLGLRLHLKRPGKGIYFTASFGVSREEYSRQLKCIYQPDESYYPYNYFLNYVENIPDTTIYKTIVSLGLGFDQPLGSNWTFGLEPGIKLDKDNIRVFVLAKLGRY